MMPDQNGDIRPVPDPTHLTTAALLREVTRLDMAISRQVDHLREVREAQDAINDVHFAALERRSVEGIAALKELHGFDIQRVEQAAQNQYQMRDLRFELLEKQRLELKDDNQKALNGTLTANKEALLNLSETYQVGHTTLTSIVDEVKLRLTALEAKALGSREISTNTYVIYGLVISLALLIATTLHIFSH